jgi:hypothetical protein
MSSTLAFTPALDLPRVQRLATYCAAASRSLVPITTGFRAALASRWPQLARQLDHPSAQARTDYAWTVTDLIKSFKAPQTASRTMARINKQLLAAGMQSADLPGIRQALLSAMKSAEPELWSSQIESDFIAAFDIYAGFLNLPTKGTTQNAAFTPASLPSRKAA